MTSASYNTFFAALVLLVASTGVVGTSTTATAGQIPSHHTDSSSASLFSPLHFEFVGFEIAREDFALQLVFVGPAPKALSDDDILRAIDEAASAWNEVPCSYARFELAATQSSMDDVEDHQIPILFDTFDDPQTDRLAATRLPAGTAPDGIDVRLNTSSYDWAMDARPFHNLRDDSGRPIISLPAVLTHELGHVLGLHHTEAHNAATMAARYLSDGRQKTLSADDKLGICQLYPDPGDECTSDLDCPPGAPCIRGEFGSVCDIYLADVGDYCALDLQHCPDVCHIDSPPTGTGYCSTGCDRDLQCPEHFGCHSGPETLDSTPMCLFDPEPRPPHQSCSTTPSPGLPAAVALFIIGCAGLRRTVRCI